MQDIALDQWRNYIEANETIYCLSENSAGEGIYCLSGNSAGEGVDQLVLQLL